MRQSHRSVAERKKKVLPGIDLSNLRKSKTVQSKTNKERSNVELLK